jgi:hypothetical protein
MYECSFVVVAEKDEEDDFLLARKKPAKQILSSIVLYYFIFTVLQKTYYDGTISKMLVTLGKGRVFKSFVLLV